MNIENNKVLVQIGTNDGSDEFSDIVKRSLPSKVILVEPNKLLNFFILDVYEGIKNVFLENVAIVNDENKKLVRLVIPKNNINGNSVNGARYEDAHYSLLPMDDWGDDFDIIEAEGITFNYLCKKHRIDNIHYLCIDTEGYDAEIIKSIDFSKINIDIIKYENWSFTEDCFKRYGDDSKLYGANGMNYVSSLLQSLGYDVIVGNENIVAIKKLSDIK